MKINDMMAFDLLLEEELKGKEINGWKLNTDNMSGTITWTKEARDKTTVHIFASPYFDTMDKDIPIDIEFENDNPKSYHFELPFKTTFKNKKDFLNSYFNEMKKLFSFLENIELILE